MIKVPTDVAVGHGVEDEFVGHFVLVLFVFVESVQIKLPGSGGDVGVFGVHVTDFFFWCFVLSERFFLPGQPGFISSSRS